MKGQGAWRARLDWLVRSSGAVVTTLLLCVALTGTFALVPSAAHADLQVLITKGVSDPIPIAVVPFGQVPGAATAGGFDVAGIVQQDLDRSGRFRLMPRTQMHTLPTQAAQVQTADWRAAGSDYVLVGRVSSPSAGVYNVDCDLINTATGQLVGSQHVIASAASLRNGAHRVSDFVYQRIFGVRGAFATQIAYVSVTGEAPIRHYQLVVADADGFNPRVILESGEPIMSPAWSADGQWLAYVSFESRLPAIYVQQLSSGMRRLVSARAGVNNAPAFSPDGRKLALTLSGSGGNLDIWLLDLATQRLTRLTDDPSADTEAAWSPDGASIYFTSDRAGGPQIYKLNVANPARIQRITFDSSYDARAAVSPDGKHLAFITIEGHDYRIAVQDLSSGTVTVLSHGHLDQSPSFAPNGATIIYAGRNGDTDTLQTVSVDGLVTQQLSGQGGEVREPVWGPFSR
jgi:TolB protein